MMIRPAELAGIKAGTIDLAFRRWAKPRVVVELSDCALSYTFGQEGAGVFAAPTVIVPEMLSALTLNPANPPATPTRIPTELGTVPPSPTPASATSFTPIFARRFTWRKS